MSKRSAGSRRVSTSSTSSFDATASLASGASVEVASFSTISASASPRSLMRNSRRTFSERIWFRQVLMTMRLTQCSIGTFPLNCPAAEKIFTMAIWQRSSSLVRWGRWERTSRATSG